MKSDGARSHSPTVRTGNLVSICLDGANVCFQCLLVGRYRLLTFWAQKLPLGPSSGRGVLMGPNFNFMICSGSFPLSFYYALWTLQEQIIKLDILK
jgi:hypothetical protein